MVCGTLLVWLLQRTHRLPLDHPNERSLHDRPIPRIGGLGLIPGLLVGWLGTAAFTAPVSLAALGAAFLFLMSAVDDRRGLSVRVRLGGHLAAAIVLALALTGDSSWMMVVLAALAIAWMTNLYNFMDGANGLAGGMAACGFGIYGLAAALAGADALAALSLAVAGAALAFLPFNIDPARMFLGDAGSVPLGFLAGTLGLIGVVQDVWPVWFPFLVFSPFILDASVTLTLRLARRERIWQAHCSHYYQRLIRMGWTHRQLAMAEYVLMAATGVSALGLCYTDTVMQSLGLGLWLVIYVGLMTTIDRRWNARTEVSA